MHYLFSDDDPEILTAAALEAVDAGDTHAQNADGDEGDGHDGLEERMVIVDLAADGKSVTSAVSLSKEWQALRTEVGAAPSMGGGSGGAGGSAESKGGDGESGRSLMLKISGMEAREQARETGGDLEALVRRFGEMLGELDEVVGKEEGVEGEGEAEPEGVGKAVAEEVGE